MPGALAHKSAVLGAPPVCSGRNEPGACANCIRTDTDELKDPLQDAASKSWG